MQLRKRNFWVKAPIVGITTLLALGVFLITGCYSWFEPSNGENPTPAPTIPSETETAAPTITPEPITPIPGAEIITLWVPPQFSPNSGTPAGDLLQKRLDQFMEANPGLLIVTRVKGASGPGGLLESLNAASVAAPDAMPSVVAFNRSDLEQAALKSLIVPLDGLTSAVEAAGLYPYAQDLGRIQNNTFGIPFAGDVLILVYRLADVNAKPPARWADVFEGRKVVIAPMDDSQASLTLALYRSAGGPVQDADGRPTLDAKMLTQALTVYSTGIGRGNFPTWLAQLQTSGQAWQSFSEKQGSMVVTWSSYYLADLPEDARAAALPSLGDPYTLASGWSWALTEKDPATRESSIKLIEFLSADDFLAEWTAATGYLPTKPTVLSSWSDPTLQPVFEPILQSAEMRPANELMASLGPLLRESALSVFNSQASPEQAAQLAAEKLRAP